MLSRKARKALRQKRAAARPISDPYLLGDSARHAGELDTANPFTLGTEEYDQWAQGWSDSLGE